MKYNKASKRSLTALIALTMLFPAVISGCSNVNKTNTNANSNTNNSLVISVADESSTENTKPLDDDSLKIKPVHAFLTVSVGIKPDGTVMIAGNTGEDNILDLFDLDEVKSWNHLVDIKENVIFSIVGLKDDGTVVFTKT